MRGDPADLSGGQPPENPFQFRQIARVRTEPRTRHDVPGTVQRNKRFSHRRRAERFRRIDRIHRRGGLPDHGGDGVPHLPDIELGRPRRLPEHVIGAIGPMKLFAETIECDRFAAAGAEIDSEKAHAAPPKFR